MAEDTMLQRLTSIDAALSVHTEILKQIADGMQKLLDAIEKLEARIETLENKEKG